MEVDEGRLVALLPRLWCRSVGGLNWPNTQEQAFLPLVYLFNLLSTLTSAQCHDLKSSVPFDQPFMCHFRPFSKV